MLTCNSNRLPIRSTTRAFFQVDMVPCVFLIWPRYLGNANLICGMRYCTQIVNQTIDLCECFSKGLRMTCCISQCSLGVYFTDTDTGIYSKGVHDMRAFCVIVIGKTTRTQYPSSHSRISQTFVQFTIIVTLKIRISIDYVMRSFSLLDYPSNMCAVRATWPLVDESLSSLIPTLFDLYHPYTRLCIHSYQIRVDKYLFASYDGNYPIEALDKLPFERKSVVTGWTVNTPC